MILVTSDEIDPEGPTNAQALRKGERAKAKREEPDSSSEFELRMAFDNLFPQGGKK